MQRIKVIAIDPGTTESSFIRWDGALIYEHGICLNGTLLDALRELCALDWVLVIEGVSSFGMPVGKEVFQTVFWAGRFAQRWADRGGAFCVVPRAEIKLHHCQTPRAKDANIRQSLIDKYGPVGNAKNKGPLYGIKSHEWAAFAVATYWIEKHFKPDVSTPTAAVIE